MKHNQDTNDNQGWIPLTIAAKMAEASLSTVRRWCDTELVESKRNGNVRTISKNSLLHYLSLKSQQNSIEIPNKNEQSSTTSQQPTNDKRFEEHLITSLEAERRISAELREQNKYLQSELLKITKEMQSILNKDSGLMSWLRTKKKD